MKKVFSVFMLSLAFLLVSFGDVRAQEVLTNQDVIAMTKAGLDRNVIIGKIRSTPAKFDLSTNGLIELKQANVDDIVVHTMLEANSGKKVSTAVAAPAATAADPNDPAATHDIGIYFYEEKNGNRKMTEMEPNSVTQSRTGGLLTSAITYGIGKTKIKAKLPGATANLQITESQPVFYFYLNEKDKTMGAVNYFPASVNQFQLVKLDVKENAREVTVGKMNAFGGKFGISDEYVVQFSFEKLRDGVYKVTPKSSLPIGEYGFYLIGTGQSTGATFFDFGVRMIP
jgi:hypothetical protein